MLYSVHRVTISIKLRPVKLEQVVSESLPHKGLYTELLGVQLTCLDPVPASIRSRNAQEINITNCDVTTWSWVNLVHPFSPGGARERGTRLGVRAEEVRQHHVILECPPFSNTNCTSKIVKLFKHC